MIEVAAGVLIDARGRLLLAQRPVGKHLDGLWEFPGGKLEVGETAAAALARELREELGIIVLADRPRFELPWTYAAAPLHFYVRSVSRWQGEPTPLEHQQLQWAPPGKVDQYALAPADRRMLQLLLDPD